MNALKLTLFFAFSSFFQVLSYAQDWVSYESQQQINDLVESNNELLMATDAGLVLINKSTLEKTIYNRANSNLSNNHIQTITKAANGDTWIGTYDVILGRFDGTNFHDITFPEHIEYDPLSTELYDFKIAPNGDFWLGTSDGVFHKQGETWIHYDHIQIGNFFFKAWDIEIDDNGDVFLGSATVHKYSDGEWSSISDTTGLFAYDDAEIFLSSAGDLYFTGHFHQVGKFDGEHWHEFHANTAGDFDVDPTGSEIINFAEDTEGNVYFNTEDKGIYKLVDNTWTQQLDEQTELFADESSFFYIDQDNKRWLNNNIQLSVNNNGMIQSTIISQHTIENNRVRKIRKDQEGNLYFVTSYTNTISILDPDGNWSSLDLPLTNITWENFTDVLYLNSDDIWLASSRGLYNHNGSEWIFHLLDGCQDLAIDSQGKIYARSSHRIYMVENNTITDYNADNSPLTLQYISGFGIDHNDNLWISSGGDDMIQKISSNGTWTTFSGTDHPVIDGPAGAFHFDEQGNVWTGLWSLGVAKFDGDTWTNPIINNNEIINQYVNSVNSDANGKLYFSHEYGMTTLEDGVWNNILIDEVPQNFSFNSSIEFDNDGTLWWASNHYGTFSYSPESTTATFSESEANSNFSIYPNPAKDYLTIDFTSKENAKVNFHISNHLGQIITGGNLGQFPSGSFQQFINTSNFPKGIYSVHLQINDKTSIQKVIIQ